MNANFDARRFLTFEEGTNRVKKALAEARVDSIDQSIFTSKDAAKRQLDKALKVENVPDGFVKWQLPVVLDRAQMFISSAAPGAKVPAHLHKEGAGVRFIMSGSIMYEGQELTAGDWMYIPAGMPYSFDVGPLGALMCYCYACCCA